MIRAVLDANAIAFGMARFRTGNSPPAVILRVWVNGDFELLVSDHILREALNTLAKPYFIEHVDLEVSRETLEALADFATHVRITHSVSGMASHPEDDRVLEAARSADADYLVTGDGPFQKVESYGGVAIISPRTFREILDQHSVSRKCLMALKRRVRGR